MTIEETEAPADAVGTRQPIAGWVLLAVPVLGMVFFVVLAGIGIAIAAGSGNLDLSGGVKAIMGRVGRSYDFTMAVAGLFYVGLILSTWLLLPKRGPASLTSYFPPVSLRWLATGAGTGLALAVFIIPALGFISSTFHINLDATDAEKALLPKTLVQLVELLVMGAVLAPLAEEMYFRGLFLRWLRKRLGIVVAAIINVVSFAALHGRFLSHPGLGGVVATAGLCVPAIALVYFAVRSRSLWPGVVVHGFYNGLLLTLSYFAPNIG